MTVDVQKRFGNLLELQTEVLLINQYFEIVENTMLAYYYTQTPL